MAQSFFKITLLDISSGIGSPLVLINNPAGMQDFEITYKRHSVYGTIFREIGGAIRFTLEGADYIRTLFDAKGIDANCDIEIKEIVLSNKTYSEVYTGIIDFSTYTENDHFVEVGIIDNSDMAKFLARENTKVNILDTINLDNETITNPMPSPISLRLSPINPVYWALSDGAISSYVASGLTTDWNNTITPIGATDPNYLSTDYNESNLKYTNSGAVGKDIIFKNKYRTQLTGTIIITDSGHPPGVVTFDMSVKRYDTGATVQNYNVESPLSEGTTILSFDNSIDAEFTNNILSGDSQGLYTEFSVTFDTGVVATVDFDYETVFETYDMSFKDPLSVTYSSCRAFRPIDIGNMIMEQMGIDTVAMPFISTVFGTGDEYEFILLATGKDIRTFPTKTPINISFREFYEGYSKVLGLLFTFTNTNSRMDKFSYYYDGASGSLSINEVSNFEKLIAEDRYFSRIKAGYKNYKYDNINGNIEFNTEFEYSTINQNTNNVLDIRSNIRADSLGIELLRRNQHAKNGIEDIEGDTDLFLISAVLDGANYRAELGSDFASIEGMREYEQYYNYRLSPKSNLSRNSFLIDTSVYYLTSIVKYIKSRNNLPLIINGQEELDGTYTYEDSVQPVYNKFDTILTPELKDVLKTEPNNGVEFVHNNSYKYGFFEEVKINLYKKTASIKMVRQ